MSRWMYPHGQIVFQGDKSSVERLLDANDDLPRGSEGPIQYYYCSDCIPDGPRIDFHGELRDRGWNDDIADIRAWFNRIIADPRVTRAYVQVQVLDKFVAGFYYINSTYHELAIPAGFIDLDS